MKSSIRLKLDALCDRYEEVGALLSTPEIISDQNRFRELSQEYSEIEPVVKTFENFCQIEEDVATAKQMLAEETDADLKEMAREELDGSQETLEENELVLQKLLLPKDPNDRKNVFLEVRAGTGGDEAGLFAAELFRLYQRYAESKGWKFEPMDVSETGVGGYKEASAEINGKGVFAKLKFESGVHRVQRVPVTESGGRVHTSAATVAVLPEAEEVDIDLKESDIRFDVFRASGPGGQSVNTTDSAVRLTHIPTGVVAECQQERSQHKNRAKAMQMLISRIQQAKVQEQVDAASDMRRNLVGSGDRSERIRTYNFPQGRMTDHRINLTLYSLGQVMQGDLDEVIAALQADAQATLLAEMGA